MKRYTEERPAGPRLFGAGGTENVEDMWLKPFDEVVCAYTAQSE